MSLGSHWIKTSESPREGERESRKPGKFQDSILEYVVSMIGSIEKLVNCVAKKTDGGREVAKPKEKLLETNKSIEETQNSVEELKQLVLRALEK